MKKMKTLLAAVLAGALSLSLAACSGPKAAETTTQPTDQPTQEVFQGENVRLAVLSGPTGIGAAKLLSGSDNGDTVNHYTYTVASDNNEVVAGLTAADGEYDIAMVASNVAANLYNKTEGDVKILALGTQGVLHILEGSNGTAIQSMKDLKGKTIYATGQGANPEYILRHLLTANGLDPDKDVEIVFADATEISAKLISGEIEAAMLPVPAATAAIAQSKGSVRDAIDLTTAWNDLDNGSQLIMSAVVASSTSVLSPIIEDLTQLYSAAGIGAEAAHRLTTMSICAYMTPHNSGVVNALSLNKLSFAKGAWIYFYTTFVPGICALVVGVALVLAGIV